MGRQVNFVYYFKQNFSQLIIKFKSNYSDIVFNRLVAQKGLTKGTLSLKTTLLPHPHLHPN